ncbi:Gfo/Idh/MocA family protein [Planctomycetota bacterium]
MATPYDRRQFLQSTSAAALSFMVMKSSPLKASPNNKVVLAIAGIHGRGHSLAQKFLDLKNVEIKTLIDVDKRYWNKPAKTVTDKQGHAPVLMQDYRQALEDKDIDALIIATPDHWHAPMTIEAVKAGKHAFVEKPCSHNPHEGELVVAAMKKHGKLVQMGSQRRSTTLTTKMVEDIRKGIIGEVRHAKTWYARNRGPIGFGKVTRPPSELNFDLWQGPAPRTQYRDNIHPYNWHWFWNWGTGEALNNGTHELDVARWALGEEYPSKVISMGARYHFPGQDDWQAPDTQTIAIEFASGKMITWEGLSCSSYKLEGSGRGVRFNGTEGSILYLDHSYKLFDKGGKLVKTVGAASNNSDNTNTLDPGLNDYHAENFVEGIRGTAQITAPVDEGHKSVLLGHLGNIAQRTQSVLICNPTDGHILNNPAAEKLWQRSYESGWEPSI